MGKKRGLLSPLLFILEVNHDVISIELLQIRNILVIIHIGGRQMKKGTVHINLSSQIVKGKLIEIVGEKFIIELEDKSKCVVTREQLVNSTI